MTIKQKTYSALRSSVLSTAGALFTSTASAQVVLEEIIVSAQKTH